MHKPPIKNRPNADPCGRLAACAAVLVVSLALVETLVPNASGFWYADPTSQERDPREKLKHLPTQLEWGHWVTSGPGGKVSWADYVFSYPVLLCGAGALSAFFMGWLALSHRRLRGLEAQLDGFKREPGSVPSSEDMLRRDEVRRRLQVERRRRNDYLDPMLGAFTVSLALWLTATVVAGKWDPSWTRAFLVPPMLVAQNLQYYGDDFLHAMLRSSWHMLQGIIFGVVAGLALGFSLSHVQWLRRWTSWHVTIVSALPPILLTEIFRQLVQFKYVPIFFVYDEVPFKSAVALVTWAVTWPVLTATVQALSGIDEDYRRSLNLLGAETRGEQIRYIELPVVGPPVVANLSIGFVIGLIVLLYAERYGAPPNIDTLGKWFGQITDPFELQSLYALLFFTSVMIMMFEGCRRLAEVRLPGRRRLEERRSPTAEPSRTVVDERRRHLKKFEDLRTSLPRWDKVAWRFNDDAHTVRFSHLRKTTDGGETLFEGTLEPNYELYVRCGSFVSIIGQSGAGKSTLLKLLIGFDHPDEDPNCLLRTAGIDLVGKEGNGARIRKLACLVSYVSQKHTLLPHLSVEKNLLFGLKRQYGRLQNGDDRYASLDVVKHLRAYTLWLLADKNPSEWRWPKETREGTLEFESPLGLLIRFMGLDEKMESLPSQLSGGEAQRVHLLRWLILGRPILVMDEAFSALDQPLKGMVRDAIVRNSHAFGTTVLNVSHDRADILQVSDRILFIHEKKVVEKAPPAALYYEPRGPDTAIFLGHSNLFKIHRDPCNRNVVFLEKDVYRGVDFTPPVPVRIDEDVPFEDGLVFIPRSFVNIEDVAELDSTRESTAALEWLQIDDLRFTGTDCEVRLSDTAGARNPLVLDAVVQDDDLGQLTHRQHHDPSFVAQKKVARMSIHRVIEIKGAIG